MPWRQSSLPVVFLAYVALWTALGLAYFHHQSLAATVATGVLYAAASTGYVAYRRSRPGEQAREDRRLAVEQALRTGEVPADPAVRPRLRVDVDARRLQLRRLRTATPTCLLLLGLGALLVGAGDHRPWPVAVGVGACAAAAWSLRSTDRQLRRLDRLAEALDAT